MQVGSGYQDTADDPLEALENTLGRVFSEGHVDRFLSGMMQDMAESMAAHSHDIRQNAPEPPPAHASAHAIDGKPHDCDELPLLPFPPQITHSPRKLGTPVGKELTAEEKAARKAAVEAERQKQKAAKLESAGAVVYLPSDNAGIDWSSMAGCAHDLVLP